MVSYKNARPVAAAAAGWAGASSANRRFLYNSNIRLDAFVKRESQTGIAETDVGDRVQLYAHTRLDYQPPISQPPTKIIFIYIHSLIYRKSSLNQNK